MRRAALIIYDDIRLIVVNYFWLCLLRGVVTAIQGKDWVYELMPKRVFSTVIELLKPEITSDEVTCYFNDLFWASLIHTRCWCARLMRYTHMLLPSSVIISYITSRRFG